MRHNGCCSKQINDASPESSTAGALSLMAETRHTTSSPFTPIRIDLELEENLIPTNPGRFGSLGSPIHCVISDEEVDIFETSAYPFIKTKIQIEDGLLNEVTNAHTGDDLIERELVENQDEVTDRIQCSANPSQLSTILNVEEKTSMVEFDTCHKESHKISCPADHVPFISEEESDFNSNSTEVGNDSVKITPNFSTVPNSLLFSSFLAAIRSISENINSDTKKIDPVYDDFVNSISSNFTPNNQNQSLSAAEKMMNDDCDQVNTNQAAEIKLEQKKIQRKLRRQKQQDSTVDSSKTASDSSYKRSIRHLTTKRISYNDDSDTDGEDRNSLTYTSKEEEEEIIPRLKKRVSDFDVLPESDNYYASESRLLSAAEIAKCEQLKRKYLLGESSILEYVGDDDKEDIKMINEVERLLNDFEPIKSLYKSFPAIKDIPEAIADNCRFDRSDDKYMNCVVDTVNYIIPKVVDRLKDCLCNNVTVFSNQSAHFLGYTPQSLDILAHLISPIVFNKLKDMYDHDLLKIKQREDESGEEVDTVQNKPKKRKRIFTSASSSSVKKTKWVPKSQRLQDKMNKEPQSDSDSENSIFIQTTPPALSESLCTSLSAEKNMACSPNRGLPPMNDLPEVNNVIEN